MRHQLATATIALSILVGMGSDTANAIVFDFEWRGTGGFSATGSFSYDENTAPPIVTAFGPGPTNGLDSLSVTFFDPGGTPFQVSGNVVNGISSYFFLNFSFDTTTLQLVSFIDIGKDDGQFGDTWLAGDPQGFTNLIQLPFGVIDSNGPITVMLANQAPDCSAAFPSPDEIWPPNHEFHEVLIEGVTDADGDPITIGITQIAQDEPIEGRGDGNTAPDADGIGDDVASLRAERSGLGDGRVYHVSFQAEDGQGGVCEGTVQVCAPHDQDPANDCVDQGPLFDAITGEPLPLVIGPENGGFETGDFTGWGQINSGFGGIVIDDGSFDPDGPGGPVAPFAGSFSAATFQGGPGVHTLFQDVALLPGLLSAKLLWADHLQNHAGDFVDPIQEWRVEVWDPADNSVLAELFSTNPGDLPLQGWTERMADLSPWIGQTIRLAFTQEDNLYFFNARLDEVRILGEVPLPVTLDIRPGVATNLVNPAGAGVLRVAILGSETFDVSDVNLATLTFGADGAATVSVHAGDVNGDGTLDLISDHATSAAGIVAGDTSACVNGVTQRGEPFEGCDSILTVPPSCGIGFELALLLPGLMWLHRRRGLAVT
jgi:hypothetical protein